MEQSGGGDDDFTPESSRAIKEQLGRRQGMFSRENLAEGIRGLQDCGKLIKAEQGRLGKMLERIQEDDLKAAAERRDLDRRLARIEGKLERSANGGGSGKTFWDVSPPIALLIDLLVKGAGFAVIVYGAMVYLGLIPKPWGSP